MEKKNTGLIVIIVVMALIIGALGGYIVANRLINKEPIQSENDDNNNNNDSKPEDTQFKLKNKYSVTSDKLGELRMTIELKDNNEVEITSGDGAAVIEQTKGTYQVKNGKLIVTREYYHESTESGDVWQKFTAEILKSFGLTATEEFTIDKIDNQLKLSSYQNGRFSNMDLK